MVRGRIRRNPRVAVCFDRGIVAARRLTQKREREEQRERQFRHSREAAPEHPSLLRSDRNASNEGPCLGDIDNQDSEDEEIENLITEFSASSYGQKSRDREEKWEQMRKKWPAILATDTPFACDQDCQNRMSIHSSRRILLISFTGEDRNLQK